MARPPKYKTAKEMQAVIDRYFEDCKRNRLFFAALNAGGDLPEQPQDTITDDEVPTVSGLAVCLGMTRRALLDYQDKDKFLPTIKEAKARIESYSEQRLHQGAPTGMIFSLKNNFGWKDKTEQELTGANGGPVQTAHTVTFVKPDNG